LNEREELENLKKLLFKAIKEDDKATVEVLTEYMEGFCQIKHDGLCSVFATRFDRIETLIKDNALEQFNQIKDLNFSLESVKKELGMNGYAKDKTKLDKLEFDHITQDQWEKR